MIRVVIVDDHAVVRAGLGHLLATVTDVIVVGEASDGQQAVATVEQLAPDVVLMDLSMPVMDGIAATRVIAARWPAVRVVGLTSSADSDTVIAMLDAGAVGYLLKETDAGELIRGIRSAAVGHAPMAASAAAVLLRERTASPPGGQTSPATAMTPREREVLALLVQGLSNRRIATALSISETTVKAHLTRVYQALGVSNRNGALRKFTAPAPDAGSAPVPTPH